MEERFSIYREQKAHLFQERGRIQDQRDPKVKRIKALLAITNPGPEVKQQINDLDLDKQLSENERKIKELTEADQQAEDKLSKFSSKSIN